MSMKPVVFVGAGPGDPELLTLKAARLIRDADLIVYAGSLVPREVLAGAGPGAEIVDSAPLTLEQTHALLREAALSGRRAVRVHTGDPSLYGAIREQIELLERDAIPCEVVPGVTAAFAAAALAGVSFTVPEVTQSLILTRTQGRTPMPSGQGLAELAGHGAALAVYLSAGDVAGLAAELRAGGYPDDTLVIAAHRVGWPDQGLLRVRLGELEERMAATGWRRQTVFLILPGQDESGRQSRLYAPDFQHGFRE